LKTAQLAESAFETPRRRRRVARRWRRWDARV